MRVLPELGVIGANVRGSDQTTFRVWAPRAKRVEVLLEDDVTVAMDRHSRGYHQVIVEGAGHGTKYRYRLDEQITRPDPASRWQPHGVHGPSAVLDHAMFAWSDQAWSGRPLTGYVILEIHIGTFTAEGTFDAAIDQLDDLATLGITAVEVMPVAQFPGSRNWGYDGVLPFAVQDSYGGPEGLKRFVDAAHSRGLAVVLDVVYNHLGPEGNHLDDFGPYFTDRYATPWGGAVNVDDEDSDEVRRFFVSNAVGWIVDFHIDALRLDAIHAIHDRSASPFLAELTEAVHDAAAGAGRHAAVIAESDLNDPRVISSRDAGGLGFDAQWSDDFHHAVHALLTGERIGYYADFGDMATLASAMTEGYAFSGGYSDFRRRRHGAPAAHLPGERFVVYAQNHDQVGNRMLGERLVSLAGWDKARVALGLVLLSPYVPMLFMGEEYAETAPFRYFVSHSEPELIEAVARGRRDEFAAFEWDGAAPDPNDPATFRVSVTDRTRRTKGRHRLIWNMVSELLRLRRETPALSSHVLADTQAYVDGAILHITRRSPAGTVHAVFCLADERSTFSTTEPMLFDSDDLRWGGAGATTRDRSSITIPPWCFVVLGGSE